MTAGETSDVRYTSFDEFWPYYVSEHRLPTCRWLHFAGTLGVLAVAAGCALASPVTFLPALGVGLAFGWAGWESEARRNAAPILLAVVAFPALSDPRVLFGVVWAYGFAWAAHFLVEKNRPATFSYPLWSLAGDFRMFGHMLRGRLWTGDGSDVTGPVLAPGALVAAEPPTR